MSLFKKKCEYCRKKIEKGTEHFEEVTVPGYVGTFKKAFCCRTHVNKYGLDIEEYLKKPRARGGCCG